MLELIYLIKTSYINLSSSKLSKYTNLNPSTHQGWMYNKTTKYTSLFELTNIQFKQ